MADGRLEGRDYMLGPILDPAALIATPDG